MNTFNGIGNVTGIPTYRMTNNNRPVCNIRVAMNEVYRDKQGEKVHRVEYLSLTAWGELADYCHTNLIKGTQICFSGPIRTSMWDRKVTSPSGEEIIVPTETKSIECFLLEVVGDQKTTDEYSDLSQSDQLSEEYPD